MTSRQLLVELTNAMLHSLLGAIGLINKLTCLLRIPRAKDLNYHPGCGKMTSWLCRPRKASLNAGIVKLPIKKRKEKYGALDEKYSLLVNYAQKICKAPPVKG